MDRGEFAATYPWPLGCRRHPNSESAQQWLAIPLHSAFANSRTSIADLRHRGVLSYHVSRQTVYTAFKLKKTTQWGTMVSNNV
jgi:hypothetical protein